ncbi:prepilin peptidase [Candidatus Woesearchaeota archaeon]|nr:prepilin peptidase [Candidatus Woesearchaeota archaeon]
MMVTFASYLMALFFLVLASITDLKTKEVPYSISYSFILLSVIYRVILSINSSSITPILHALYGFLIFFTIGYLLYKVNLWGGADATLLFAMGILFGYESINGFMPHFLINLFIIGGVFGILYCLYKGIKENLKYTSPKYMSKIYLICSIFIVLSYFLIDDISLKIPFFFLIILIPISILIVSYTKLVQDELLIRKVSILKLTEGDWINEDIKINGKIIVRKRDNGISLKQLEKLNELYKKGRIRKVTIKEGMPFIPSFLISLIITYYFGNILLLLL